MKLWINFDEKDIRDRKEGWREGDDWETQMIYESKQEDIDNCKINFRYGKVQISFDNGWLEMTQEEFGEMFK